VDLGDFIAGPFPEKQSPPSAVILSQQRAIIKKRNSLSANYAEIEILFIIIPLPLLRGRLFSKNFPAGRERRKEGGRNQRIE
jgi:hypothetical protein